MFFLRCCELGLSWEVLGHLDIGAVYDMQIERANDKEEWNLAATKADIEHFFGKW